MKPYRVATAVFLVLGVLCLLVELQSPSLIFWTGERVQGTNDGGIIYYTVGGQNRTLNDPREPPDAPVPVTVYADPDDASRDRPSNLARGVRRGLRPRTVRRRQRGASSSGSSAAGGSAAGTPFDRLGHASAVRPGSGAGPQPSRSTPSR